MIDVATLTRLYTKPTFRLLNVTCIRISSLTHIITHTYTHAHVINAHITHSFLFLYTHTHTQTLFLRLPYFLTSHGAEYNVEKRPSNFNHLNLVLTLYKRASFSNFFFEAHTSGWLNWVTFCFLHEKF